MTIPMLSRIPKAFILALVLLIGASIGEDAFTPVGAERGYLASSERGAAQPSSQALAHALGEFRIVAANLIWLNVVDRYHHEYMAAGGNWSHNASLLPFIRMITWLDPHFVEAYDVASTILPAINRYDEGIVFLKEGIRNNPTSWQLYYDEAMLNAWYRRDARTALPLARKALDNATDPYYQERLARFVKSLQEDVATGSAPVRGG